MYPVFKEFRSIVNMLRVLILFINTQILLKHSFNENINIFVNFILKFSRLSTLRIFHTPQSALDLFY